MDQATTPKEFSRPIALILGATHVQWRRFGPAIERAGYRVILVGSARALPESRAARQADLVVYQSELEDTAVLMNYQASPHRPALVRLVEDLAFPEAGFDPAESQPCDPAGLEQTLRRRLGLAGEPFSNEDDRLPPQASPRYDPPPSVPGEAAPEPRPRETISAATQQPLVSRHTRRRLLWMALLLIVTLVLIGMWRGRPASRAERLPVSAASDIDLTVEIVEIIPSRPRPGDAVNIRVAIHNRGTQPVTEPFWVDLYFAPREQPAPNRPWPEISGYGATWLVEDLSAGGTRLLDSLDADGARSNVGRLPPGPHWELCVLVDSYGNTTGGAIVESNETNNLGRLSLTLR